MNGGHIRAETWTSDFIRVSDQNLPCCAPHLRHLSWKPRELQVLALLGLGPLSESQDNLHQLICSMAGLSKKALSDHLSPRARTIHRIPKFHLALEVDQYQELDLREDLLSIHRCPRHPTQLQRGPPDGMGAPTRTLKPRPHRPLLRTQPVCIRHG